MLNIASVEANRVEIQNRIDSSKTAKERNRLGQFATPARLADDIVNYALSLFPKRGKIHFLDPAIGTGSFFSALIRAVPASRIASAVGYEIDTAYAQAARDLWDRTCLKVLATDFLEAITPHTKSNLVICNPPYVRHHHLDTNKKLSLRKVVTDKTGINLNGLAGLYCYFMLAAHDWLAENGIASWLIPSEFTDVNYGQQLKEYLLDKVTLIRVHRFDPLELQFDDALVSNSVLWFKKSTPRNQHIIEFTFGGTVAKPRFSKFVTTETLKSLSKWSNLLASENKRKPSLRLSDFFDIKRGVATGANEFFILSLEKITELDIPIDVLIPILPSPRYLRQDEILADEKQNPIIDKPRFLLSCNRPLEEIKLVYPTVWKYLQSGMKAGIHERYLCRHRSTWYAQETRQPARFLCTYMGRQFSKGGRPFRFIHNQSRAIAPNVYLMMYPKPDLAKVLADQPELSRKVWGVLNTIPIPSMIEEGRVYGDGLHKLEPRELANISADALYEILPTVKA
jgi:hypothetical protein